MNLERKTKYERRLHGKCLRPKYKNKDGTVQQSQVWWIKYYRDGRPHRESSGSQKVGVARVFNVASKRDLDVVREKMERNAMERLYAASNPASNSHPNSHHFARDGQSLGKVEPILGSSDAQNSAKLLEVNDGPVAQKDRAAVS